MNKICVFIRRIYLWYTVFLIKSISTFREKPRSAITEEAGLNTDGQHNVMLQKVLNEMTLQEPGDNATEMNILELMDKLS